MTPASAEATPTKSENFIQRTCSAKSFRSSSCWCSRAIRSNSLSAKIPSLVEAWWFSRKFAKPSSDVRRRSSASLRKSSSAMNPHKNYEC